MTCPDCQGVGGHIVYVNDPVLDYQDFQTCATCKGRGAIERRTDSHVSPPLAAPAPLSDAEPFDIRQERSLRASENALRAKERV